MRRGIRTDITLGLFALAWAVATWPWIAAAFDVVWHPARARTQDVMNVFPLLCVACSAIAVARGGPSRRPALEPSMLAAVPLLGTGLAVLWLGVPRYGLDALDDGVAVWAASLCMLASMMFVCGVRHTMRHAAWIPWVLAVPPLAIALADAWSAVSTTIVASATLTASSAPPAWMMSGTVGLALWLTCASFVVVSGGLDHGRRIGSIGVLLAVTLATAWLQAAAWALVSERSDALIGGIRVAIVVVLAGVLHRRLARRAGDRERWRSGWARRPEFTNRYVGVASFVVLFSIATATALSWHPTARAGARLAAVSSRPTLEFVDVDEQHVADIELPRTRSRRDALQLPSPWDRRVLPLGPDRSSCQARHAPWWIDVWDDPPIVVSFAVLDRDEVRRGATFDEDDVTWVVELPAPGRGAAQAFEPTEQLRAHLVRVSRARHVAVGGASATLLYVRHHGQPFAVATTTQAIELPDGRHAYRSLVVARAAQVGTIDESMPAQSVAFDLVNRFRPYRDRASPIDADFAAAGRHVIDTLEALLEAGRSDDARTNDPRRDVARTLVTCDWYVGFDPLPRVERLD